MKDLLWFLIFCILGLGLCLDAQESHFSEANVGIFCLTYFDGQNSHITIPYSKDFEFSDGDFTIDFWINLLRWHSYDVVFSTYSGYQGIYMTLGHDGKIEISGYPRGNKDSTNGDTLGYSWKPSEDVWYHMAVVKADKVCMLFINGKKVVEKPWQRTIGSPNPLCIGGFSYTSDNRFKGYMDKFRIRKGVVCWRTADFTPDTQPTR